MSFFEAVLLGIVQGLTEFLPVSSSGHLVLAKSILGIHEKGIAFEIFVHFGTLLAVITFYKNDLLTILHDIKTFVAQRLPGAAFRTPDADSSDHSNGVRLFALVALGSVPTAVLGLIFRSTFESAFSSPLFVSYALLFTGLLLLATRLAPETNSRLNPARAILVGFAQVVAFFPGVSRSGTTISTALYLGVEPTEAARFSFLLVIPVILGVTAIKTTELFLDPPGAAQMLYFAAGSLSAYLSGLWAIKWLVGVAQRGRFSRFAYYCFFVGGVSLLWSYAG